MQLQSIRAVAGSLNIPRDVLSFLIETNGITTYPIPTNGKAKGLDARGVRTLKALVERVRKPVASR